MDNKPKCPLIGANSNIFNLMGIASRTLKDHGYKEEAEEMFKRITNCTIVNKSDTKKRNY